MAWWIGVAGDRAFFGGWVMAVFACGVGVDAAS